MCLLIISKLDGNYRQIYYSRFKLFVCFANIEIAYNITISFKQLKIAIPHFENI